MRVIDYSSEDFSKLDDQWEARKKALLLELEAEGFTPEEISAVIKYHEVSRKIRIMPNNISILMHNCEEGLRKIYGLD